MGGHVDHLARDRVRVRGVDEGVDEGGVGGEREREGEGERERERGREG